MINGQTFIISPDRPQLSIILHTVHSTALYINVHTAHCSKCSTFTHTIDTLLN